jgi:hypothetical protein
VGLVGWGTSLALATILCQHTSKPAAGDRSHSSFINIIDNDSLLNIFYLYRPVDSGDELSGDGVGDVLQLGKWIHERWWYKLVHVCRRWRYLILASPSFLGICLLCTRGVPIAAMLAHAPPVPLIIDHFDDDHDPTPEEENGIILALQHRDRVRRIRLLIPLPTLRKVITAIDGEFPMVEYLYIGPQSHTKATEVHDERLVLPETFRAPHIRHLILLNFALPMRSPVITTAVDLVTLTLLLIPPSGYFSPDELLERISLMPQLETLWVHFYPNLSNGDVENQLVHVPIASKIALPRLRWFGFDGANTYLEALLPRMTTPLLEKLTLGFFIELTFPVPHLLHFVKKVKDLKCGSAKISLFNWGVLMKIYPHEGAKTYVFKVFVGCTQTRQQISSVAQICNALETVLSAVEYLTFEFPRSFTSPESSLGIDPTSFREILRSFKNVKTIRVPTGLLGEVSNILPLGSGKSPDALLPELRELVCPMGSLAPYIFAPFIKARESAGAPVTILQVPFLEGPKQ